MNTRSTLLAVIFGALSAGALSTLIANLSSGATFHFWVFWRAIMLFFVTAAAITISSAIPRSMAAASWVILTASALTAVGLIFFIAAHF